MGLFSTPFHAVDAKPCTESANILKLYEPLHLVTSGMRVTALVDTGAEISSIDKMLIKQLKINAPVVRQVYVRTAHGTQRRDIIRLKVKLRNRIMTGDFTLSNRKHMKQKILLGRNLLKGFLIDVSR